MIIQLVNQSPSELGLPPLRGSEVKWKTKETGCVIPLWGNVINLETVGMHDRKARKRTCKA